MVKRCALTVPPSPSRPRATFFSLCLYASMAAGVLTRQHCGGGGGGRDRIERQREKERERERDCAPRVGTDIVIVTVLEIQTNCFKYTC